ncbi:hypothetical protein TNCT_176761 [Trichonephila clavata]|uniref:Uncharacterized protein n=1 Tax=Trichonephila clavata TaxID=2740835 RepID=A0A8X6F044_TRICU|nr:hypothetical protein TNCT_176761 [Trichonephila clavata]
MDPGNSNIFSDSIDLRLHWNTQVIYVWEKCLQFKSRLQRLESLFSFVKSEYYEIISLEYALEGRELEPMEENFQNTEMLILGVSDAMESLKEVEEILDDRLRCVTSHIAGQDCVTQVTETNNLIELCEYIVALMHDSLNFIEHTVTGVEGKVRVLAETYIAQASD